MAYVNMTVDGQTKRTSTLYGKDVAGNTKTMTFSAVLESSDTQGSGITPSGTKQITANGTYDVTEFASAEVNVPTSGGDIPQTMPEIVAFGDCVIDGNKFTVPYGTADCDMIVVFEAGASPDVWTPNGLTSGAWFRPSTTVSMPYNYFWVRRYNGETRVAQGITQSAWREKEFVFDNAYGVANLRYIAIKY